MFFLCPADKNKKNKRPDDQSLVFLVAEREGFEPPEQLPVHRISSAARSTTPAFFRFFDAAKVAIFLNLARSPLVFFCLLADFWGFIWGFWGYFEGGWRQWMMD